MMDPAISEIYKAQMTSEEFNKLSSFIYNETGIKMPPVKITMLQSRLQKRLRHLKISTFKEYIDYVFGENDAETEIIHMIDAVSTNKTDFFREPLHFEFLAENILPELIPVARNRPLKIWSAGCSSGEEAYTIAITISEFNSEGAGVDFSILGTDISTDILQKAVNAVYREDRTANIPISIKKRYFMKSRDPQNRTVRIIPEIRKKVSWKRLNFMESYYDIKDLYDIVFCRNVLIYFDRATQESVINKLCANLKQGGFFFLGHSESIMGMDVPLRALKPTIYQKI
ncbi:MAG: CheR family methyltransferase [Bacteroidales bacterium]